MSLWIRHTKDNPAFKDLDLSQTNLHHNMCPSHTRIFKIYVRHKPKPSQRYVSVTHYDHGICLSHTRTCTRHPCIRHTPGSVSVTPPPPSTRRTRHKSKIKQSRETPIKPRSLVPKVNFSGDLAPCGPSASCLSASTVAAKRLPSCRLASGTLSGRNNRKKGVYRKALARKELRPHPSSCV